MTPQTAGGAPRALCLVFACHIFNCLLLTASLFGEAGICQNRISGLRWRVHDKPTMQGPTKTDQFDGAVYLSVEADEFAERRVKLLLFERSTLLAAIDLMPHPDQVIMAGLRCLPHQI